MKKAIIIGGGISGLTSAIMLNQIGYKVLVIEKRRLDGHKGGGVGIQPNGTKVLFSLGLQDELIKISGKVDCVRIGLDTGKSLNSVPVHEYSKDPKYRVLYVKRGDLINILKNHIPDDLIITECSCIDVKDFGEKVYVQLENGKTIEGDLLIGADGINSIVRKKIFGDKQKKYLNHISLGGIIEKKCSDYNHIHGYQKFCVSFPCSNGNYYTIMFCPKPIGWLRENAKSFSSQLNIFRGWSQDVDEILNCMMKEGYFCLESYGIDAFKTIAKGRTFLVGDSASPMTPMGGFAVSLALEGVSDLCELLKETENLSIIYDVYNKRRYTRAIEYNMACDKVFLNGILNPDKEKFHARINELEINEPKNLVKNLVNMTHPTLPSIKEALEIRRLELETCV